jgi:hypothetical protein
MAEYQYASDYTPGYPPSSGVIRADGKWVACAADSPDWDAYVEWAKTEGNVPDPYKHPDAGGVAIVLEEGEVPVGVMLDSLPADQGGNVSDPLPVVVDVPQISGTPAVGETLTATMGNWEHEPALYDGAWTSDGVAVVGYGTEYVVQQSDAGHTLTCVVTATNSAGATTAPPSNEIAIPAMEAPPVEPPPETQTENHRSSRRHRE